MTLDLTRIRVVAFDLFGTVFDLSNVPREEIRAYVDHFERPEWSPLVLPSSWAAIPAHLDAIEGLTLLRQGRYRVVTCTNAPLNVQDRLIERNGLTFDTLVPIEANRVFKPSPVAYLTVCQVCQVDASEVLMVTANPRLGRKDYGDVEAAREVGMQSVLIRGESDIPDIIALAERLGC